MFKSISSFYTLLFVLFFSISSRAMESYNKVVSIQDSQFGISILEYGAKPASDWSQAVDNSAAIQKAIDENPKRMIYIPTGIYLLSKPIVITHDVYIVGENKQGTILQPINCDGIIVKHGGVTVRDIFIYGGGNTGIRLNGRNNTLSNIILQNVAYGIKLENAWNTKMDNIDITINYNQNPKVQKGLVLSGQCVNNHLTNSQIIATEFGIEIQRSEPQSEGFMINNVLVASAKTGIKSEGMLSLHLINSIIDLCTMYGLDINRTSGLLVTNCWIASQGKNNTQTIKLSYSWDSHINSNNIKSEKGVNVLLIDQHSNNNIITNNTLELALNNKVINLDKSTSMNIIKDNSFKMPKLTPASIIDYGSKNQIINNLNLDIK